MGTATNLNIHVLMLLILVAACVAIVVKWIRLPYSIALVLVGLTAGIFHILPPVALTPELILVIFLPAMLYEAAWGLDVRSLKENAAPISVFATLGVVLSTLVVGGIIHLLSGIALPVAMVLGAIVSATDPISVLALFREIGIQKRLITILEGESLLNDGTAVVLFRILLAAAIAGGSLSYVGIQFVIVTLGGTLLGALIGIACCRLMRLFDDHLLEITLSVLVAYGSYLLAEFVHVSSVIAVLVAGMIMGSYGRRTSMSPSTRLAVSSFWEYAAFIAESLVFLMIGLQIRMDLLAKYAPQISVAILAILAGRIVVIYGLSPFVSSKSNPIPLGWRHLLFWGGLRGSLCMAMALSIPADFPFREQIIVTVFGVALFTLLVQGLTMKQLVDILGLDDSKSSKVARLAIELKRQNDAVEKLDGDFHARRILKTEYRERKSELAEKIQLIERSVAALEEGGEVEKIETAQTERALIEAQKDCLNELSRSGAINEIVLESYRRRLSEELEALRLAPCD